MMGTNDTGYINKVAIGGHIALDTVLLISYVVELLKGSRTLSYFLVVAAFMIIPIAVELAIYSKKKDAASIRHILAITYGVLSVCYFHNEFHQYICVYPAVFYFTDGIFRYPVCIYDCFLRYYIQYCLGDLEGTDNRNSFRTDAGCGDPAGLYDYL